MQSELKKAARDFMFLFIVDGGDRGISLDDIDPMEFSQKFAALEAALSTGKMQEICSVSFADREAATVFLRDFTKSEGGLSTVDWYALRDRIADKISMTRIEERDLCRTALWTDAEPVKTAPAVAVKALRDTLEWYGEQARLAKLIHSEGDPGRWALAEDGGKRANAALSAQVQDVADPIKAFAEWLNNGPGIAKAAGNVIDVRVTTACGNKLRLTGGASPASKHGDAE